MALFMTSAQRRPCTDSNAGSLSGCSGNSRKSPRVFLAAIVAAALLGLVVPPALAAAPGNDLFTGATAVGLGFSQELDTTQATTDADDVSMNRFCGAPATDASVWYSYSPASDGGVIVDVSTSTYSAGVIVATGSPGNFALQVCGPRTVEFRASAGSTYYILAFDDQLDGSGTGGLLRISFNAAPPPPTVNVSVDPVARFNSSTGGATLTGTFTCTNANFVTVFGDLRQPVGRFTIHGSFFFFSSGCNGAPQAWTAQVVADNGKFAGGKSAAVTFSFACGPFECATGFTEQQVQLRGGK